MIEFKEGSGGKVLIVGCMRCPHVFEVAHVVPSAQELECPECGTVHVFRLQKNHAVKLRVGKLKKK